jgi:Protein of unknown function (DUF3455)
MRVESQHCRDICQCPAAAVADDAIATLLLNDKTVGRHYAGPTWEDMDGNAVTGKAVADAPGTTPSDIALLKLDVEIKIDTFNFTRYGLLHGQVLSVSS